jgi:hypothetical protein
MIDIGLCYGGERGIPQERDPSCGYPNALQNRQWHIQAKLLHSVEGPTQKKPPQCRSTEEPSSPGKLMMVVFAYANDFDDASRFSGAQGSGVLGSYAGVYHAARS